MATTMIVKSRGEAKRVSLTIEQKAEALKVFDIQEPGHLAVPSGSNPKNAYVVHHNGDVATYCPCHAYGRCAHKIAVNWYLEALNREFFDQLFDPNYIHSC